jgi:hypothetical protein
MAAPSARALMLLEMKGLRIDGWERGPGELAADRQGRRRPVGTGLGRLQRQDGLGSVEHLDLGLFVDRQDQLWAGRSTTCSTAEEVALPCELLHTCPSLAVIGCGLIRRVPPACLVRLHSRGCGMALGLDQLAVCHRSAKGVGRGR